MKYFLAENRNEKYCKACSMQTDGCQEWKYNTFLPGGKCKYKAFWEGQLKVSDGSECPICESNDITRFHDKEEIEYFTIHNPFMGMRIDDIYKCNQCSAMFQVTEEEDTRDLIDVPILFGDGRPQRDECINDDDILNVKIFLSTL
jgi:hypothetical protein